MIPATLDEAMTMIECCGPSVAVTIADRLHEMPCEPYRRFIALVGTGDGAQFIGRGPTRMCAMLAVIAEIEKVRPLRPSATPAIDAPENRQLTIPGMP